MQRSRIIFDASCLNTPHMSGVPRYVRNLIQALSSFETPHEWIALGSPQKMTWPKGWHAQGPSYPSICSNNSMLSFNARAHQADLLFIPWGGCPIRRPCPGIVVVHDIIPFIFPELAFTEGMKRFFNQELPKDLRHADAILTVSGHTKRDLIKYYQIDPERIFVTPLGVEPCFFEKNRPWPTCIPKETPYLLFTGLLGDPRKNHLRLLEAFQQFLAKHPEFPIRLAFTGLHESLACPQLTRSIREFARRDRLILTNEVSHEELLELYAHAFGFVFPSIYEGFGLPILEAMAQGVPCLLADNSSLPEVGGDAAIYCNGLDVDSIAQGLERLILDDPLREILKSKSLLRAQSFTWEKTAQLTLDVMDRVLQAASAPHLELVSSEKTS
jgi:glycosyltransferase involved in cell wall biosynthesis